MKNLIINLLDEAHSIKEILQKKKNEELTGQKLTLESAISMLAEIGYPISKSLIYKLTSQNRIPYSRFGNRLIFDRNELVIWCKSRECKAIDVSKSKGSVVKSASLKFKTCNYGK